MTGILTSSLGAIAGWVGTHKTLVSSATAILIVLLYAFVYIDPLNVPPDSTSEDISAAWNDAISRLGIAPVFPPEEDLHVGDIWAVISNAEERPLLGKAVRIGHLDLEPEKSLLGRPVFPDTAELKPGESYRHQDGLQIEGFAAGKIKLTLTAFPGVTISRTLSQKTSFLAGLYGFVAGKDLSTVDELRIPVAESYGVGFGQAVGALSKWCGDEQTKLLCSDAYARRLIAFGVSDKVLKSGITIQLRLVTRVFLMRSIEQRRRRGGSRGVSSEIKLGTMLESILASNAVRSVSAQPTSSASNPDMGTAAVASAREAAMKTAVAEGLNQANLATVSADEFDVSLRQTFQRPLVFGFRAVTIRLEPQASTGGTRP